MKTNHTCSECAHLSAWQDGYDFTCYGCGYTDFTSPDCPVCKYFKEKDNES